MSVVFTSAAELFTHLGEAYEPGIDVDIATYNMYLGVSKGTDWSQRFPSPTRTFVNRVDKSKLRILLGQPAFFECFPGCEHCRMRFEASRKRDVDTARMLGLNIRVHDRLHLKYYRVGDLVIVGGINLGMSDALDASLIVTDWNQRAALVDLFEVAWNQARELLPKEVVS